MAENFTDETLPTIALVSLADPFGNDQPEPRNTLVVDHAVNDKRLITRRLLPLKHTVKFTPFSQPHVFGKTKIRLNVLTAFGHGVRLLLLINPDFGGGVGTAAEVVFFRQLQQIEIESVIRLDDENRILRRVFV